MNTRTSLVLAATAALLLAGFTGCQSPNNSTSAAPAGPATGAVLLSSKKTFDIVGRMNKKTAEAEPTNPSADVTSQTARNILESRGYVFQPDSPDFLVSIAWNEHKDAQAPTPTSPQPGQPVGSNNLMSKAEFGIVVRDRVSGAVLWQSPGSEPVETKTLTDDQAQALTRKALADFPPSQASGKVAGG